MNSLLPRVNCILPALDIRDRLGFFIGEAAGYLCFHILLSKTMNFGNASRASSTELSESFSSQMSVYLFISSSDAGMAV